MNIEIADVDQQYKLIIEQHSNEDVIFFLNDIENPFLQFTSSHNEYFRNNEQIKPSKTQLIDSIIVASESIDRNKALISINKNEKYPIILSFYTNLNHKSHENEVKLFFVAKELELQNIQNIIKSLYGQVQQQQSKIEDLNKKLIESKLIIDKLNQTIQSLITNMNITMMIPLCHRQHIVQSYNDGGGSTLSFGENDIFVQNAVGGHFSRLGDLRVARSGNYQLLIICIALNSVQNWKYHKSKDDAISVKFVIHDGYTQPTSKYGYFYPSNKILQHIAAFHDISKTSRTTLWSMSTNTAYLLKDETYYNTIETDGYIGRRQYYVQAFVVQI